MKDAPFDSACMPKCYQGESVEKCHACLSTREDEGVAYSPAEDKPVSPRDMTYLSAAQRISALSVSIMAKAGGGVTGLERGGVEGKNVEKGALNCALIAKHSVVCVCFIFCDTPALSSVACLLPVFI